MRGIVMCVLLWVGGCAHIDWEAELNALAVGLAGGAAAVQQGQMRQRDEVWQPVPYDPPVRTQCRSAWAGGGFDCTTR